MPGRGIAHGQPAAVAWMRPPAVLAAFLLLAWAGAACGTSAPSPAAAAEDASFLASVHNNAPDISVYRSDVALVRLGHAACDDFSAGVSYEELADRLSVMEGAKPVPIGDLGAVINAAVESYCPRFQQLVG